MTKRLENGIMVGTMLFLMSLFLIGGLMTRDMDITNSISDNIIVNI